MTDERNAGTQIRPRLTSGFVFKSVFGDSPKRCGRLIEVALDTKVESVEYVQPEREFEVLYDKRGGRLDLYVVAADGRQFDVEIQAVPHHDEWMRARHYQALMDATQLRKGTRADDLPECVVIFICDFDPLEENLRRYDCQTVCLQTGRPVPDGRRLVLLNARGRHGEVSPELDAFLRFVAGEEVEDDSFVSDINDIISAYITNPEWLERYMTFEDELEAAAWNAARHARKEGEERGMAIGKAEGKAEGRAIGKAEGKTEIARKLVREGVMDAAGAAAFAGVDVAELQTTTSEED